MILSARYAASDSPSLSDADEGDEPAFDSAHDVSLDLDVRRGHTLHDRTHQSLIALASFDVIAK
jgi:hypothetical protein